MRPDQPHNEDLGDETRSPQVDGARGELLLVGSENSMGAVEETLETDDHRCVRAGDAAEARQRILETRFDVIIADLDECAGRTLELAQLAARLSPATVFVVRSRRATVDTVLAAMRAGIGDYLTGNLAVPHLKVRIRAAVRRSREGRVRIERLARLRNLCRTLVARRHDGDMDIHELASLMNDASSDSAAVHEPQPAPTDFGEMARDHLDPETLVTSAIEHLALVLGPVNVAVFLGSGDCRFGLAAYARADLPRARIESLLGRWSNDLCPLSAADGSLTLLADAISIADTSCAAEVGGRTAIVAPCKIDGVCDAVVLVLGAKGQPLAPGAAGIMERFRVSFAQQLSRIQRVHSRYRLQWPREDD